MIGPHIFVRGEGIYVFDDAGKRYIEGLAGLVVRGARVQREAVGRRGDPPAQHASFLSQLLAHPVEPAIELADYLVSRAPTPMSKVFFTNSGSEANDTQVDLVWYYNNVLGRPKKRRSSRARAPITITVAAGSLTGLAYVQQGFDLPIANILHTDCPHYYHYAEPGESEEQFSARLAANLEMLIEREGPDTVAAFIAEPFLGAGGVIPPPKGYFERIQPILEQHDILFIVDEVISGFYRTGPMFACETYGLSRI